MRVRVEILGPVRLFVDGTQVSIKRKQVERALVVLAAFGPKPITQSQLVEHLWGDSLPADPKASLRVALSRLRATLGDASDEFTSEPTGYRLQATTDLAEFEGALLSSESAGDDQLAIPHWTRAGELWTDTLVAFADAPLLEAIEGRLRRSRDQSIPAHAECLYRLGRFEEALKVASEGHDANLGDERLAIVCARALAATGRKAGAIELLTSTRTYLRDHLGLSPSDQLVAAEDRIVRESLSVDKLDVIAPAVPLNQTFVGRRREIDWLSDVQPGLHTVAGLPGSGKTALVTQAVQQLEDRGRTVLWARASQTPTRPMEPLTELVTQIANAIPTEDHSDALRSVLSRLAPGRVEGAVSQPASRDGLLALSRQAIEEFATEPRKLVVVIDDAQWLDRSSAHIVNALIDNSNVALIATVRDSTSPSLDFLVDETRRVKVLQLSPLTRADIEAFVARDLPALPLGPTTDKLFAQSGGNALFVTLLADLIGEGALSDSALPPNVLVTVQQRLAMMSKPGQHTLEIASVFADSIPVEVLADLVPGAQVHVAEAIEHGLLIAADTPGRYRFAHSLVAEATYQLLADGSRLDLHDEVGRLLEEAGASAAEYALHCGEAATLDPARAVGAHLLAAKEFADSFDWDTALLHAQRGIGFHHEYQLDESAIQAELLVVAGAAWRAQGKPEGDDLLIAGVDIALAHQQTSTAIYGLLALCTHGRMTAPEGVTIHNQLQRAMVFDLSVAEHAQLLACEATLVAVSPLQDQGRRSYARAFAMLSEVDNVDARRQVLSRTHLGFPHPADLGQRVAATAMLQAIAGNDPDLQWEVAYLSFGTAMVHNQADAAESCLADMRELAPRIRMRQRDYGLRFSEAAWARFNQDLEKAEVLLGEAVEIGQESYGEAWSLVVYAAVISSVREVQGRIHELLPLATEWSDADPDWPTWRVIAAAGAASSGDLERTRREIDWLKQDDFECLSPDVSWPAMLSFLTGPVALLHDAGAATTLLQLVEPYAGLNLWNGACIHQSADEVIEIYRQVATGS